MIISIFLASKLPDNFGDRLKRLFTEYEKRETKESKLTKELGKIKLLTI